MSALARSVVQSKAHWERAYSSSSVDEMNWYQARASRSLSILEGERVPLNASVIDVGGGASPLAGDLLRKGFLDVTVLDISVAGLDHNKARLGSRAGSVKWLVGNVTKTRFFANSFDVWHDRALFHYLVSPEERRQYIQLMSKAVKPGGLVIMATFAENGPSHCSGLPVARYSPSSLYAEIGTQFSPCGCVKEDHRTPGFAVQKFIYCSWRKRA